MTIWTANYLTGVKRGKTAVLEWNDHGDFFRMRRFCEKREHGAGGFRILDVDYYGAADAEKLTECLNRDYRYILIDYGELTGNRRLECARCDKKILVGALSEWQADAFLEEVKECGSWDKSWRYTVSFGSEETRKQIERSFSISLLRIPSSGDAFVVTRPDMDFFKKLLETEQ